MANFTQGKPTAGSEKFTARHDGVVYRLVSAENRDLFRAKLDKYAPAYGGYRALGRSFGKKFDVDGHAFRVVEGRLYVNKNLDVYATWKKGIPDNIVKADGQWPLIQDTPLSDL